MQADFMVFDNFLIKNKSYKKIPRKYNSNLILTETLFGNGKRKL